jgi:hypothetical protein
MPDRRGSGRAEVSSRECRPRGGAGVGRVDTHPR